MTVTLVMHERAEVIEMVTVERRIERLIERGSISAGTLLL